MCVCVCVSELVQPFGHSCALDLSTQCADFSMTVFPMLDVLPLNGSTVAN